MKCEICKSAQPVKDEMDCNESVWPQIMIGTVIFLDAHPSCLKKAILAAGELIS